MQDSIYWSGHNFELNITFGTLRDYQWKRLLDAFWAQEELIGPLQTRYVPGHAEPSITDIQYPKPTDTFSQHGILSINNKTIGIDVLVTRSLFECLSISAPTGMFVLNPEASAPATLQTDEIKIVHTYEIYQDLALNLHENVPFELASIGWNRECQILTELIEDSEKRKLFIAHGNFFATDESMIKLGLAPNDAVEAIKGVRWVPASR